MTAGPNTGGRRAGIIMVSRTVPNKTEIERVTIPIDGLACWDSDMHTIERVILRVEGVRRAYVNSATEMAYVEYDPSCCDPGKLAAAIDQGGFHAGPPVMR